MVTIPLMTTQGGIDMVWLNKFNVQSDKNSLVVSHLLGCGQQQDASLETPGCLQFSLVRGHRKKSYTKKVAVMTRALKVL